MTDTIAIGDRKFTQVAPGDLTVGQHLHYDRLVVIAGLRDMEPGPGESPEAFGERLLEKMLGSGDLLLELIGTVLLPAGRSAKEWTLDMARETARFLSTVPGEENLHRIHELVGVLYLNFFEHGLLSSKSSTNSGQPEAEGGAEGIKHESSGTGNGRTWSVN